MLAWLYLLPSSEPACSEAGADTPTGRVVRGCFDARDDMWPVSRDELQGLMRDGLVH